MPNSDEICVEWYGPRTVKMVRMDSPSEWPEHERPKQGFVFGPESKDFPWAVALHQNFRRDGSCFWTASVRYPVELYPLDGYDHSLTIYADSAQAALDELRKKLDGVEAWIRVTRRGPSDENSDSSILEDGLRKIRI